MIAHQAQASGKTIIAIKYTQIKIRTSNFPSKSIQKTARNFRLSDFQKIVDMLASYAAKRS